MAIKDDLQTFDDLKNLFNALDKEQHDIHEEWRKLHDGSSDQHLRPEHHRLLESEMEVLQELRQVLISIAEFVDRNLK